MTGGILLFALAVFLALAGLTVAALALCRDPLRKVRRCPKCWYDMSATAGLLCPECGRAASKEGALFRVRRRWRLAVVGLVMFLASTGGLVGATIHTEAWVPFAPTVVLIRLATMRPYGFGPGGDVVSEELRRRVAADSLSTWEYQYFFDRLFAADPASADCLVRTRTRWPAGLPIAVSASSSMGVFFQTKLDGECRVRVRLLDSVSGGPEPWVELNGPYFFEAMTIGTPPAGVREVHVGVELYTAKHRLWRGVRTVPVEVRGTIEDLLKPVSDQQLDAAVTEWLRPTMNLVYHADRVGLEFREVGRERAFGRYVALGIRYTLFKNGRPFCEGTHVFPPPLTRWCGNEPDYTTIWLPNSIPDVPGEPGAKWEIDIAGDASIALMDYDQFGWASMSWGRTAPWTQPTEFWSGHVRVEVAARSDGWGQGAIWGSPVPDLPYR